jgi:uncharacterized protein YjiS (DUF1127 family)
MASLGSLAGRRAPAGQGAGQGAGLGAGQGWAEWMAAPRQGAWALLCCWYWRRQTRLDLAQLDERMRHDIGADPTEVWRECQKPFWRS